MELPMFDNVKFEKEKAIAKFNSVGRLVRLWQFFEVALFFVLISWCSTRAPAVLKLTRGYFVEYSTYVFNHHVVFLIGNAIIVLLLTLCRENDVSLSSGRDFYDAYVKYSEVAAEVHRRDCYLLPQPDEEDTAASASAAESGSGDCEKQIVVRVEEIEPISQCDDVAEAIEKATRQIQRFERTQSEILKPRTVRWTPELRRSETENCRKVECTDAADIETLSGEDFRRMIDDFIYKHWSKGTTKQNQLKEFENSQLRCGKIDPVQYEMKT